MGAQGQRVAIAGGGPGGLSAAIALRQAGFDVTLFERHATSRGIGGAILLNAISIHVLRSYGIEMEDVYTGVSRSEFQRYDGRFRALWRTDPELYRRAGASGWLSGMMREEVFSRMVAAVPDGVIENSSTVTGFTQDDDGVTVRLSDGTTRDFDLLFGADGIRSVVRDELWGPSDVEDIGIVVWLGWCELEGPRRDMMVCRHDDRHQLGFAPLRHHGKDCFEWWFVEPLETAHAETDRPMPFIRETLGHFADPVPAILDATRDEDVFRWVVQRREPLDAWSSGRVTLLGDACHPTSPYAGYGAGMAIEDGFFLGRFLTGVDLSDRAAVSAALGRYDAERVAYCNRVTEFARTLGRVFHNLPRPARRVRDVVLDHTRIPDRQISKGYTADAQVLLESILSTERETVAAPETPVAAT
jgi:2-polyprenyl-6-methoxyphenol hydroxylase-like FAD-dependent oxidoreductase